MNRIKYYITEKEVIEHDTNNEVNKILNNELHYSDCSNEKHILYTLDNDNIISINDEMDYKNYNIDKIRHIYNCYYSSKKKIKKSEMINNIILFESNPENFRIVYNRKRMWYYLTEIQNDSYFKKFTYF